jgi:release factor glutamine methyltransferase
MKQLLEILNRSIDFLKKKGIENPRRQAEEVLCDALGIKRIELYVDFERPLNDAELERCRERIVRRGQGEPTPYIHGSVEFYGCKIAVNRSVLIPRQETELLIDRVVQELSKENLSGKVLWDLCCGSGYIGIALKKKFPDLEVVSSDICPKALAVARSNASANNVEIEFLEGDLFAPFGSRQAHFIVCNPPYISEEEFQTLSHEVREFEPKLALVSGTTGLEIYQRIADQLTMRLLPGGKLWFEIGHQQGHQLHQLFSTLGSCQLEQDYSGHDRFFRLDSIALKH